jgi:hypothetical protein
MSKGRKRSWRIAGYRCWNLPKPWEASAKYDQTAVRCHSSTEYGVSDASITGPAFTGEWRDVTGVQYHWRPETLNAG